MNCLLSLGCLPFQGIIVATNQSLKAKRQRVKAVICAAITTAVCIFPANAQTNEWTWMGGSKTPQVATFGTLGVPSAGNLP